MSAKNHDAVKDLPYSEPVKAYIACNLELEYAMQDLLQRLENAGIADRTLQPSGTADSRDDGHCLCHHGP